MKSVALIPVNDKLEAYHSALDFIKLDSTDFMYLKLPFEACRAMLYSALLQP
jgi:hypothetical protein